MDAGFIGQQLWNGVMLGTIYAMVAVGFTLFFGVLDVIKFSHGDVLTLGVFAALATALGLQAAGVQSPWLQLAAALLVGVGSMAALGALIARAFILPLREAPSFIVLLVTLMVGTVIRESIRLFYPGGSNPQSFPHLLPAGGIELGSFTLRFDSLILLATGLGTICAVHLLITRTRLGLAIRAVAQDGETARVMGIDFTRVVLFTFALGSGLAALAGLIDGLYYSEVNFGTGLMLGVIGFSAAVVGGLGNLYGAILGGFLFAALQMLAVVALPLASEYKDVVAFAGVILLIGLKPTGLIGERAYERV
ncbi:branched-chain amino acid ABC transporter permease [Derxia lacustris]|uniref:branched-chain amino acid ABC transporter permease n=1 Tax=Derxia lacustris TaxID=764842 RepID=UPI000A16F906|nr:branched-chain amino acid ABC transporter permease [Derxia lacustris]